MRMLITVKELSKILKAAGLERSVTRYSSRVSGWPTGWNEGWDIDALPWTTYKVENWRRKKWVMDAQRVQISYHGSGSMMRDSVQTVKNPVEAIAHALKSADVWHKVEDDKVHVIVARNDFAAANAVIGKNPMDFYTFSFNSQLH